MRPGKRKALPDTELGRIDEQINAPISRSHDPKC